MFYGANTTFKRSKLLRPLPRGAAALVAALAANLPSWAGFGRTFGFTGPSGKRDEGGGVGKAGAPEPMTGRYCEGRQAGATRGKISAERVSNPSAGYLDIVVETMYCRSPNCAVECALYGRRVLNRGCPATP